MGETAEELEVHLLFELFDQSTEHFSPIHSAELLDNFKEKFQAFPRWKAQVLQPSRQLKASSDSSCSKRARENTAQTPFIEEDDTEPSTCNRKYSNRVRYLVLWDVKKNV